MPLSLLAIATDGFFCPAGTGSNKVVQAMPTVTIEKLPMVFIEPPDESLIIEPELPEVDRDDIEIVGDNEVTVE